MSLTQYFGRFAIEGFSLSKLHDILTHRDTRYSFNGTPGALIIAATSLGDEYPRVIRCVNEYWTNDEGGKKIAVSGSSHSLKCHLVRQAINYPAGYGMNCVNCHLHCLESASEGTLRRINNKSSKKGKKKK
jgi:hypothetical protein